ncbi:9683_t:CDS:2 [Scutellospora calospora]|uniref:9683_t:CDS:1 n=1 Tax=Scutellospora calospora TaxID=85575 RepID=A0ACA9JV47_9GLOM|nr:9683_t:CDS:2 [Scutellospora calospora]
MLTNNNMDSAKGACNIAGRVIDIVAPYIPLFDIATKLIKEIIDIHDAAQYNKHICARLMDRVIDAQGAIEKLKRTKKINEEKFKDERFYKTFQRFTNILDDIKEFEIKLSKMGSFKKNIEANLIRDKFINLTKEFDSTMNDLSFSLMIENEEKRRKDAESLKEDFEEMEKILLYTKDVFIERTKEVNQEIRAIKSVLDDKLEKIADRLDDSKIYFKPEKIEANQLQICHSPDDRIKRKIKLGELLIQIEELHENYVEPGSLPQIFPDNSLDLEGSETEDNIEDLEGFEEDFGDCTIGNIKTIMPLNEGLKIHHQIKKGEFAEQWLKDLENRQN